MKRRNIFFILLFLLIVFISLTIFADLTISTNSGFYLSDNIDSVPVSRVGLLLGTSKRLSNGERNDFFYNRIDAAVLLYFNCKIEYIIVSGDNADMSYNEPMDMKRALVARGLPDSVIYLDYAGFRTLDSVVRAKDIFGQDSVMIISQKFHNERAIYIARRKGIYATGFNAKDVDAYKGFKTMVREFVARDKVFLDFMFNVQPKFGGDKVLIQ